MIEIKSFEIKMKLNYSEVHDIRLTAFDNPQRATPKLFEGGHSDRGPTECDLKGERQCEDGQCISGVDLCPEEQLMNQNTILIMIVVGLAVVIFLIVLYCFQQRNRGPHHRTPSQRESNNDEEVRVSLYMPPPTYEEVVTTNLYPPTPQLQQRGGRLPTFDEGPPLTPPPNYEAALTLLARSHESVLLKPPSVRRKSSCVSRRSLSVDFLQDTPDPVHINVTPVVQQELPELAKTEKQNCNNDTTS